jgi:hypothetical protein
MKERFAAKRVPACRKRWPGDRLHLPAFAASLAEIF